MSQRIALFLQFDGSGFSGWQSQAHGNTVQDALESAIERMLGERVTVHGCSRTDAGVHAFQYVAHVDLTKESPLDRLVGGLNALTPKGLSILAARQVPPDFHARKSARCKTYRYTVLNRRSRDPFYLDRAWQIPEPLDLAAMREAARLLEGEHDFASFQASDAEPRPTIRTLDRLTVSTRPTETSGEGCWIEIEATSKGFLKYMVRNLVGTLVEVGRGKRPAASIPEILASKDRRKAAETAPAAGLSLVRIKYDLPQLDPPAPALAIE